MHPLVPPKLFPAAHRTPLSYRTEIYGWKDSDRLVPPKSDLRRVCRLLQACRLSRSLCESDSPAPEYPVPKRSSAASCWTPAQNICRHFSGTAFRRSSRPPPAIPIRLCPQGESAGVFPLAPQSDLWLSADSRSAPQRALVRKRSPLSRASVPTPAAPQRRTPAQRTLLWRVDTCGPEILYWQFPWSESIFETLWKPLPLCIGRGVQAANPDRRSGFVAPIAQTAS